MTKQHGELEWLELEAPTGDDDADALALVERYRRASNAVTQHFWGDDSHDARAEEIIAGLRHTDDEIARRFLVVEGGVDVGRAIAWMSRDEGASVASVAAWVVPDARGRGIGRAMAERIERIALDLGAASDRLETLRSDAEAAAGDAYETRSWLGRTPPTLADAMAALHARMVTDAPSADLETDDERWDAARLARLEAELEESGSSILQAIAVHRASGAPVAFTVLLLPPPGRPAFQEDTLVHADHRGHRLGMRVKAENLLQLRRVRDDPTRVVTWNAEENRPMLAVNEALGFVAVGAEGGWQKRGAR